MHWAVGLRLGVRGLLHLPEDWADTEQGVHSGVAALKLASPYLLPGGREFWLCQGSWVASNLQDPVIDFQRL